MTEDDIEEQIAERAAIIWEGSSFPLGGGRWGHEIAEQAARAEAELEFWSQYDE